jgi:hypothetical protein
MTSVGFWLHTAVEVRFHGMLFYKKYVQTLSMHEAGQLE